ncbi:MAG TPA: hypothetical protein VK986_17290, partial [Tepidisphaeraceae bacterium]|nr:hypothetical protein [Tepidisphaeraceae bacterium]
MLPPPARAADVVRTPITAEVLDPAAFAEWVDGAERKIESADPKDNRSPKAVIATDKSIPGHSGFTFGAGKTPGPRHLLVGLTQATPVGAIMVRGGARVSVLKEAAAYPGDVADESQWIAADRIKQGKVSRDEGVRDNYILWTLPAVVKTRALRFTHLAEVTEKDYAGWLGGAYVLPARVANVATQGTPVVSENDRYAGKLNNEHYDPTWEQWANMAQNSTGDRPAVISAQDPEWVMLTWAAPVKVSGVGAAFAGFSEADVEIFAGPADVHPREGAASMWQKVGAYSGLKAKYPATLAVEWLAFEKEVTTRALRVRMTKAMGGGMHPHMKDHAKNGKRVWLGELVVLSPVADGADLKTAIVPAAGEGEKPPIAVKFTLPEAGWVTLVIEDSAGKRVRNLISETYYEKGANVAWWDGSDDLGRDPSAAKHGLYYIPARPVEPGTYRVRGLWRKKVEAKYEMGVYTHGSTPWETGDRTGGWLSNHTPPSGMLFVPDAPTADGKTKPSMLIGSYVSEGTAGLAWVDLDGNKWRGQNWVGGLWTGAPHLARDAGPKAIAGNYAYVAAAWSAGDSKDKKAPPQGEIRLTALTAKEDKPVIKYNFTPATGEEDDEGHKVRWEDQIGGVAARDGLVAVSLPSTNKLIVVDVAAGKVVGERAIESPRGMAFDAQGRLNVLSGTRLVRFANTSGEAAKWAEPEVIVSAGLDAPHGLALDDAGNFYVTDRGHSHQIKVFDAAGKSVRSIGKPGAPAAGAYDPQHMNNPRGVSVDPQGRVWVAEEDYQPKRVSVWSAADGKLLRAFYGPAEYGGGGAVDPQDKSKFYYYGMEFRLDWNKGTNDLAQVYYRPGPGGLKLPFRAGKPQNAIYVSGKRYWTNAHNSNPTGGHGSAFIFADRDGVAVPVAGAGRATDWDLLKTPAFASLWPAGTDPKGNAHGDKAAFFIWSDLNADGSPQPDEVKLRRTPTGSVMVGDDLSLAVSRFNGKAVQFKPTSITDKGVPVYDLAAETLLVDGAGSPPSSGGDQVLVGPDGWTIHTTAPKPFAGSGIGGARNGQPL